MTIALPALAALLTVSLWRSRAMRAERWQAARERRRSAREEQWRAMIRDADERRGR